MKKISYVRMTEKNFDDLIDCFIKMNDQFEKMESILHGAENLRLLKELKNEKKVG